MGKERVGIGGVVGEIWGKLCGKMGKMGEVDLGEGKSRISREVLGLEGWLRARWTCKMILKGKLAFSGAHAPAAGGHFALNGKGNFCARMFGVRK